MTADVTNRGLLETMTNMNLSRLGKWRGRCSARRCRWRSAPWRRSLAQEIAPEQLALARKYVDLTNKAADLRGDPRPDRGADQQAAVQQNPDITDKIDAAIGKILETYKGKSDELFNQFARIYATTFTQDELQQIVDFYSTPAGQKLASSAQSTSTTASRRSCRSTPTISAPSS